MIKYSIVHPNKIKTGILKGYQRYTETHRVKYVEKGELLEKDIYFVDEWDETELRKIEEYMKEPVNRTILAKEGSKVVGFAVLDIRIFEGYMNMPYIHADNRFRGLGIGTNLMLYVSKLAKENGAEKLYISAHPAIEAQAYYEKMGCVLAEKINQVLYELEPYDIQLERSLDYVDIMMRKIEYEFKKHKHISSTLLNKLLSKVYSVMPEKDMDFIRTVKPLLIDDRRSYFSMGTLLIKKKGSVVNEKYLDIYEDILHKNIHGWGQVDQYCYRILGAIFNNNYMLYSKLKEWSESPNKDVRRASLVSMLISSGKITLTYPIEQAMKLVEALKEDDDFHVRKAVGWVLKCAYPTYPNTIVEYLKKNSKTLDRMIFRYALEHMEEELRQELLSYKG